MEQVKQIKFLSFINDKRIRKEENEILKLNNQKNALYIKVREQDELISQLQKEKVDFKKNYYKNLVGKKFTSNKVHFAEDQLETFDLKIDAERKTKDGFLQEIDAIDKNIQEVRLRIKKLFAKNEKFDYLIDKIAG